MNTFLTNEKRIVPRTKQTNPRRYLKRRKFSQKIAFGVFWVMGLTAIAVLLWIVGYILSKGASSINLEFLTTRPAGGFDGEGGISTTIVTTIYLVIFTIAIAAPLGVGAGIYFVEYANEARESQ